VINILHDHDFADRAWLTIACKNSSQVLISGSETTSDRRVQIWTPDYLLTGKPRPVIASALPSSVGYNGSLAIGFSGVTVVDRVVLIRPGSPTHGVHFDARSVLLNCTGTGAGSISCTAPPSSNIAPPGQYMLFILSGKVFLLLLWPSVLRAVSSP
jgi:hypothetical protein